MGLAAPRKRSKISHDPNNTNWSRSTSGFGHKILSSQGWTPGSFLGARNAAHADMFTAASASHIRVVIKDDTLGLGARAKRNPLDEPTGLDAFKGLLGRLNGKSDADLAAEQRKREDAKLARYAATKWHAVSFISGGLLAQEKLVSLAQRELQGTQHTTPSDQRGVDLQGNKNDTSFAVDIDLSKTPKEEQISSVQLSEEAPKSKKRRDKKDKDMKDRKAKKRKHIEDCNSTDSESLDKEALEIGVEVTASKPRDAAALVSKALSKERRPMGRNVFRSRHIEQKKKALLDDKSLNEIFMVKS
ncbi:telomerase inhibitor [Aspergillus hancockii]|nr:telomerase inhibitor [Aspergillus hancockii]